MKILIITHTQYNKNAYSKQIERATSLAAKGHEVTFIITSNINRFRTTTLLYQNVKILMIPDLLWGVFRQGMGPLNIIRRCYYIMKLDYTIIHGIDCRPVTIIPCLAAKFLRKKKLILEWMDLFGRGGTISERSSKYYEKTFGKVESYFEETFRKYADGNIAISQYLKKVLVSLGIREEDILVLPLACNKDNIVYEDKEQLKKELNLETGKIYLLFAGSIFPSDAQLLVKSFEKIKNIYGEEIILLLVGKHNWLDSKKYSSLNIKVTGYLSNELLYKYLGAADIHLLPLKCTIANNARFPSKLNDYFIAGRPLVATPVSDLPSLYEKYKFGIITKTDNVDDFVAGIVAMLNKRAEWDTFGNSAKECALKYLEKDILVDKLEKYYLEMAT